MDARAAAADSAPLGRRVAFELGGDRRVVRGSDNRESLDDQPAELRVDGQTLGNVATVEPALDSSRIVTGARRARVCAREDDLEVASRLGRVHQLGAAGGESCQSGVPHVRPAEPVDGHAGPPENVVNERDLALRGDRFEHECEVVPGRHLGVPGHVPRRGPDQRARQRVLDAGQPAPEDGGQRALVEPNLRPGQVVVVEKQQVRHAHAVQRRHLGTRAEDVDLDPIATDEPVAGSVVEADRDPMRAQGGMVRGCLLEHGHRSKRVAVRGDLRTQHVHARRLQPLPAPGAQVPAACRLESREQIGERGVPIRVSVEVAPQPGDEGVEPDPCDELLEHAGALGVGDSVEVEERGVGVGRIGRDRMGGGQLVLPIAPGLDRRAERGPPRR